MSTAKSVLMIGIFPELADLSAHPHLTPEKVRTGVDAEHVKLRALGHVSKQCWVRPDESAAAAVEAELAERPWECVVIGAGVRMPPSNFLLFERLINVVHRAAPLASICFNTTPADTLDAVRRWA